MVSLFGTLLVAAALFLAPRGTCDESVQRAGNTAFPRGWPVLLFSAFYAVGGQVYDLARVDMLTLGFAIWAALVAMRGTRIRSAVWAGLLMASAILTKHNMVTLGAAIGCALLMMNVRRALVFGAVALAPPIVVFSMLIRSTDGWAYFHLFKQLSLNDFGGGGRWIRFFAVDVHWHGILMLGLLAAAFMTAWKHAPSMGRSSDAFLSNPRRRLIGLMFIVAGGLAMTISGRLKAGGFSNNLVPAWTFALFALATLLPDIRLAWGAVGAASRRMWAVGVHLLMLGLVGTLAYSFSALPLRDTFSVSARRAALADLRQLIDLHAARGPVWLPAHAGVMPNARGFAHLCPAGFMFETPEFPIRSMFEADTLAHLDRQFWSAIILDDPTDRFITPKIWSALVQNYAEVPHPLKNPNALMTLSGKRTAPRRLFVPRDFGAVRPVSPN